MSERVIRRPQLTGDELQQLKWLLGGVLTLLALSTVLYMDVEAWSLMAVTALATVVMMVKPTLPARLPGYVHTLAFPVIVAFFAGDLWLKAEILPAMVRLDMLLLLYRALTYRQRRDDLQIVLLGLFLVVIAGVLTVSILFAAHLLVYTGCALALLLVITLSDGVGASRSMSALEPGVAPSWAVQVKWLGLLRRLRGVADWRVVTLGLVLFAGVVGVSTLLFLAIPRFQIQSTMFLDRLITKKAKSGFSDTIRFGDVTEIQQDNSLALSVDVSDQALIPVAPYWRMVVLDEYLNGAFKLSATLRSQEFGSERIHGFVHGDSRLRTKEPLYWTFYLESGVSRYLPLLGRFAELRFRDQQNVRQAPNLGVVALRDEPATMTAYRVEGFDLSGVLPDPAFAQRWSARTRISETSPGLQVRLSLRDADARAVEGAVSEIIGTRKVSAGEFSQRAGEWLRQNHRYSLSPDIPGGDGDPLVRWLTSRAQGHCELFAGAFVLLARSAGFPARVVTGFRGGTWNGYSNNFTIRNADAHAWAEIFDITTGAWLRADPLEAPRAATESAAASDAALIASRLDRSWTARLDSLRVFWYRRIVSFDQSSQVETLKALKEVTQNSGTRLREAVRGSLQTFTAWLSQPWDLRRVLSWLSGAGLVVAVAFVWRRFGRVWWRVGWRPKGARHEDPVRREAGRWLVRLRQGGDEANATEVISHLQRLRFGPQSSSVAAEVIFGRARQERRNARRRQRVTRL